MTRSHAMCIIIQFHTDTDIIQTDTHTHTHTTVGVVYVHNMCVETYVHRRMGKDGEIDR